MKNRFRKEMMNPHTQPESNRRGPAWSRPEFLFTGTAVTLLTGVLIPWPDPLLDILWICHVSLTAAILVICASAHNSSQLDGFPPLLAVTSFLSFLGTAACMRAIVLRQDTCGRLIRVLGEAITALEPILALMLILVIGFFILYLVLQSCRRIREGIEHYLFQILPFKRIGLETDQTLNILTAQRAEVLREKIRKEARFYASMNGLRKLLTAQIAVNLFLLLAAWGLAWIGEIIQAAAGHAASPMEALAPVLSGTAIFSWVPVGITAAACGGLLNKESLSLPPQNNAKEQSGNRKIKILSMVSGRPEEVELINPDFMTDTAGQPAPAEQIVQFEPEPSARTAPPLSNIQTLKLHCTNSGQYYQSLENLFTHKSFQSSFLLLTAESVEDLPVTVAVHPAVQLSRKKEKVLLMDADQKRHAIAQVFALDPKTLQKPSSVPRMDSLWLQVLPEEKGTTMPETQDHAEFRYRILYAPQGQWLWNRMHEMLRGKTRILFFSTKTAEEIRPLFSGIQMTDPILVIPPLSRAVSQSH